MPATPEMDEFVNWDPAAPGVGPDNSLNFLSAGQGVSSASLTELSLALENVDGDEWGYWSMEHYDTSNPAGILGRLPHGSHEAAEAAEAASQPLAFEHSFEIPPVPCEYCQGCRLACKRINEGECKGYCTGCVALRLPCSFGRVGETAAACPADPWPTFGDHPRMIPQEDIQPALLHATPPPDLTAATRAAGPQDSVARPTTAPKQGSRLSKDAIRTLKNWFQTHTRHPYPTEDEKEMLQRQTGLDKKQVDNWFANTRRRGGKSFAPRSTSPGVRTFSANPIDIPRRPGTPGLQHMAPLPLDRWRNSPPEHEPALATDIARALASSTATLSSSGLESPYSGQFTDDGSNRSVWAESTAGSSALTSRSSGGRSSAAYSHGSAGSRGSGNSLSINHNRRRRRPKAAPKGRNHKTPLHASLRQFQCTFCTQTFGTKHDWQRHEKSLHLSLERWVCTPDGAHGTNPETGCVTCVFCGQADPDKAHIEVHNHSACQERSLDERTFYRKDHLRQHLRLVHSCNSMTPYMESWKVATPEIRSRCGFCGTVMDTWTIRVEHLADHFKRGDTMELWKGGWGFDAPVLALVENSIPPFLIHYERNSPLPYEASTSPLDSVVAAYELLKNELLFFMWNFQEKNSKAPTDAELQLEACRIIYGSDTLSSKSPCVAPCWLRDLILSSEDLSRQAMLLPIRGQNESLAHRLQIKGKANIFENDDMERQLQDYVKTRRDRGLTPLDSELQIEACSILNRAEASPSIDAITNFFLRLVGRSTEWLAGFRQRAGLPRSEDIFNSRLRSKDKRTIDSTVHSYARLEVELSEYVMSKLSAGIVPGDADLQRQARLIISEFDDGWNQTAADDAEWLASFKQQHLDFPNIDTTMSNNKNNAASPSTALAGHTAASLTGSGGDGSSNPHTSIVTLPPLFMNDANCYRRLARELSRWVSSTMSLNNPSCHIPTDEELQHQARWILYDTDDNWNQTAADNAEWLQRFKRDVGIITDPSAPGLPEGMAWNISQGGSGFAPPYAIPAPTATLQPLSAHPDKNFPFTPNPVTADKYIRSLAAAPQNQGNPDACHQPPGKVFCSRELESGLIDFVRERTAPFGLGGDFPSDEELRAKAREIYYGTVAQQQQVPVGMPRNTPADDKVLLGKFKEVVRQKLGLMLGMMNTNNTTMAGAAAVPGAATATATATAGGGAGQNLGLGQGLASQQLPAGAGSFSLDMDAGFQMTDSEMAGFLEGAGLPF